MKKITKLINGSIVVFVICLIAVLTLTSCDNTNNNSLRKGQDTNITEVQGDEYQVTEKEFEKANSFEGVEYLKQTITSYKIDGEIEKDKKTSIVEYKSYEEVEEVGKLYSEVLNTHYSDLIYNKGEYKLTFIQTHDTYTSTYNMTLKYKNKKLIYVSALISYTDTDILDCSIYNFEY